MAKEDIHIFGEGNTRTTAVFFIKYLRTLGFSVTNDIFADNAWYFRNALVRANYTNLQKNIHETTEYLELFLRNLLLNENNELHNRNLHISGSLALMEYLGEARLWNFWNLKVQVLPNFFLTWCRQILLKRYQATEKENINSKEAMARENKLMIY